MATNFYNIQGLRSKRADLRNNMSVPEQRLWFWIKSKQLGYKFRRQYSIGPYIVDFYCPKLRLILEIDGDSHTEDANIKRDCVRTKYLTDCNLKIKRYTNRDVLYNLDGVLDDLTKCINFLEKNTPSNSPL